MGDIYNPPISNSPQRNYIHWQYQHNHQIVYDAFNVKTFRRFKLIYIIHLTEITLSSFLMDSGV